MTKYYMISELEYNGLHDFIMQHEIDIELENDDFGLLKEIYDFICKKEEYE